MSFGGMNPVAAAQLARSLDQDAQLAAAEAVAALYEGDERPCIQADVMNAFNQGIQWGRANPAPKADDVRSA
jgi:hypothetical protein